MALIGKGTDGLASSHKENRNVSTKSQRLNKKFNANQEVRVCALKYDELRIKSHKQFSAEDMELAITAFQTQSK